MCRQQQPQRGGPNGLADYIKKQFKRRPKLRLHGQQRQTKKQHAAATAAAKYLIAFELETIR